MTGPRAGAGSDGGVWDRGLQPERTALAWRRTGLTLGGAGLLLARVLAPSSLAAALLAGALGVATAIVTLVVVDRRYRSHHRRLVAAAGERVPLAGGGLPAVIAVATLTLGCGAALAVVLLH
jgi:Domain of unknown function (DUF202)